MLFEATRRNITVLYVTQRQNGFMIEGHREILGCVFLIFINQIFCSPCFVHRSASTDADDRAEGAGARTMGQQYEEAGPKHSLRIDVRNNASSDEAIEALLESVEFKSGVRKSSLNVNL